jgi:hypothetical protein
MYMENITSIKTKTTEGLPGEATSTAETTLMETEEGHGGQDLDTERIEMGYSGGLEPSWSNNYCKKQ